MGIKRNIVKIDEEKCTGCGDCVTACAEGAIQIIGGKAKLVSEIYCDGLGACLGECPEDAITIEQREAEPFDEQATEEHLQSLHHQEQPVPAAPVPAPSGPAQEDNLNEKPSLPCGCPGTMAQQFEPPCHEESSSAPESMPSQLRNWPVQLTLVSPQAPYFQDAELLVVADCVPFAYADFHRQYLQGKPVVVGCPKLDDGQFYVEKLTELLKTSSVKSLTVLHMEVPCCTGLTRIAEAALEASGKSIPFRDVTIGIQGGMVKDRILSAAV